MEKSKYEEFKTEFEESISEIKDQKAKIEKKQRKSPKTSSHNRACFFREFLGQKKSPCYGLKSL